MAAAKKKTTKKKTQKKSAPKKTQSRLFRVCLLLCIAVLCIIALLHLGPVGSILFQFFNWLFGSFGFVMILLIMGFCLYSIPYRKEPFLVTRHYVGMALLGSAWMLLVAVRGFQADSYWSMLETTFGQFIAIIGGQYVSTGVIGSLLLGIIGTLFSQGGCYLFVVLFIMLGVLLIDYPQIRDFVVDFTNREDEPLEQKPKKEKKKEKRKERKKDTSSYQIIDANDLDQLIIDSNPSLFMEADDKQKKDVIVPEPVDSNKKKEKKKIEQKQEEVLEASNTVYDVPIDEYKNYTLPKMNVLDPLTRTSRSNKNSSSAKEQGRKLIEVLDTFGIAAELVQIHIGPSVTKFEIRPQIGVRVSRISGLQDDIMMAIEATDIRIEAPIPGKNAVGIEVPNVEKTTVQMRELMQSIPVSDAGKKLLFCLGKNLLGEPIYGQLDRMPHLLIAGATGSGKSVCVNSIICSILMRTRPDEVKLILIDPKKVEFTPYNDVPHLLAPVVTDSELANNALKVAVKMMDDRYAMFSEWGVRNINGYNKLIKQHPEQNLPPMPRIVIIIDELADLMLVAAKEVESSIQRITQLARAAGIYLIVATQRPSVDVITGVIKANIPSRIAFAVSSAVDSRTILDQQGAERLLGYGDMLYLPNGETSPQRIQGVFIQDDEVVRIAEAVKAQGKPHYDDTFIQLREIASQGGEVKNESMDPIYEDVKHFVINKQKASTSLLQRQFSIGYGRAARLIDVLEMQGIIGPANGSKPREVYIKNTYEEEM